MDVLTGTVERRVQLAGRAELLREELAEIDAEVARLEAAEVVFGQWTEATDGRRQPASIVAPEPERVVTRAVASQTACRTTRASTVPSPSTVRVQPAIR